MEHSGYDEKKAFSEYLTMNPLILFVTRLKQFKETEREQLDHRLQTMICKEVQAKKSVRRMPWHQEPMKDVTNCDKPRGAVNKL